MSWKYIVFIGGENYSEKFEHIVWSDCSASEYFFGIPSRGILWKIQPYSTKLSNNLDEVWECAYFFK